MEVKIEETALHNLAEQIAIAYMHIVNENGTLLAGRCGIGKALELAKNIEKDIIKDFLNN